jgi:hypothetical protein
MKNLLASFVIAFLLFPSSPAEAGKRSIITKIWDEVSDWFDEYGTLLYPAGKVTKKVHEENRGLDEKEKRKIKTPLQHTLFPRQRSAREALPCEDIAMVAGYNASVYERPSLESNYLGRYEPNERICAKNQAMDWRITSFGWLEEKNILGLWENESVKK